VCARECACAFFVRCKKDVNNFQRRDEDDQTQEIRKTERGGAALRRCPQRLSTHTGFFAEGAAMLLFLLLLLLFSQYG